MSTNRQKYQAGGHHTGVPVWGALLCAMGYADALYFSRVFRRKTGVSPREFAREHR